MTTFVHWLFVNTVFIKNIWLEVNCKFYMYIFDSTVIIIQTSSIFKVAILYNIGQPIYSSFNEA